MDDSMRRSRQPSVSRKPSVQVSWLAVEIVLGASAPADATRRRGILSLCIQLRYISGLGNGVEGPDGIPSSPLQSRTATVAELAIWQGLACATPNFVYLHIMYA